MDKNTLITIQNLINNFKEDNPLFKEPYLCWYDVQDKINNYTLMDIYEIMSNTDTLINNIDTFLIENGL